MSEKRPGSLSHDDDHAHGRPSRSMAPMRPRQPPACANVRRVLGILDHVLDVDDGAAQGWRAPTLSASRPNRVHLLDDPQRLSR